MKKRILVLALAGSLLLSGCTSLLERSYSVVEPYADRYWDASAEDTLRAESYQDLVNSLLMLIEEGAEDGVIRYYTSGDAYGLALQATQEVREETMLGSYLLEKITFTYQMMEEGVCTLTYEMVYREDAEDVDSLMVLSDSQSLVDLLRLAIREGHDKLTARFAYDMPREDVEAAVAAMWREVCLGSGENTQDPATGVQNPPEDPAGLSGENGTAETTAVPSDPVEEKLQEVSDSETAEAQPVSGEGTDGETGDPAGQEPGVEEVPPCPWEIRYYPDLDAAELVEVLLRP